jgi:hypothetical protein
LRRDGRFQNALIETCSQVRKIGTDAKATDGDQASTFSCVFDLRGKYETGIGASPKTISMVAYRTKILDFMREEIATCPGVLFGRVAAVKRSSVANVVAEDWVSGLQSHA